jgi:hypothetical protein
MMVYVKKSGSFGFLFPPTAAVQDPNTIMITVGVLLQFLKTAQRWKITYLLESPNLLGFVCFGYSRNLKKPEVLVKEYEFMVGWKGSYLIFYKFIF